MEDGGSNPGKNDCHPSTCMVACNLVVKYKTVPFERTGGRRSSASCGAFDPIESLMARKE